MTLQSSGSMTIADINTELGRSAGALLSTDDAELLEMARLTSSDPITIPGDLYGKAHLGTFQAEIEVTVGLLFSSTYGFLGSSGSISPTTYRGNTINAIWNYQSGSTGDYVIQLPAGPSQNLITGIRVLEDDIFYTGSTFSSSSFISAWVFGNGTNAGNWTGVDVGTVKTIRIYGD